MAPAYGADGDADPVPRPDDPPPAPDLAGDRLGGPSPTTGRGSLRTLERRLRDPSTVRLEGVHAVKHAVRFGATIVAAATPDRARAAALLAELAPDVTLPATTVEVDAATWRRLAPRELPSPLLASAVRPTTTATDVLASPGTILVLEAPRHLGNLGAAIRVAAAADVGGVLVLGEADPWHPTAVRSSAGLGFALPVARVDALPDGPIPAPATGTSPPPSPHTSPASAPSRPLVALDPAGEPLRGPLPRHALLLVGTERAGLSPGLRDRADRVLRLPMRAGVSSLNLATAVAAALYAGRAPEGTVG